MGIIITDVSDQNPYHKSFKFKTVTKPELFKFLLSATKQLLLQANQLEFIQNADNRKFNSHKLNVEGKIQFHMQQALLNDYDRAELNYVQIIGK